MAVSGNTVSTKVGTSIVPLSYGNTITFTEADEQFFDMSNIPLTRVGDNSYLPMDIKSDFKGAIQPWAMLPYFLQEDDGTISGLRPGYNGEYSRTFYSYSETGEFGGNKFRLTDSEYRPSWLTADEYVTAVVDGNMHGFCIRIKSTADINYQRYYWVDHNGTLDSRFHTFLDITEHMLYAPSGYQSAAAFGGVTFIPELNVLVVLSTGTGANAVAYHWYTVNRAFQTVRSASSPAALPVKNVDWADLTGTVTGTSNLSVVMDAVGETKLAKYFKFINEPNTRTATYPIHPSAGARKLNYVIDGTTIRFITPFFCYIAYTGTSRSFGWVVHMDYNTATNQLRYNPVTNDPVRFQTLPWVLDFNAAAAIDSGAAPTPITDQYKSNKYPIFTAGNNILNLGNNVQKLSIVGNKFVSSYVGTTQVTSFAAAAQNLTDYSGTTNAQRALDAFRRPFFQGPAQYPGYEAYQPYDASILSKTLSHVRFISPTIVACHSASRLYGQSISVKAVQATLPSAAISGTVFSSDFNALHPSMSIPSSVDPAPSNLEFPCNTTFISGSGTMQLNRCSWNDLVGSASMASTWLAVGVNPVTGVATTSYSADPTTFKAKMAELETATVAQSTHVVTGTNNIASTMQFLYAGGGYAYFLATWLFGNNTSGMRYEYATVRLVISGSTITWPAGAATTAVLSRTAGLTNNGNVTAPVVVSTESASVYQHTDGNFYVMVASPLIAGTVGGNQGEIRMFKLNSTFGISQSTYIGSTASWYYFAPSIHPTYGFVYTSTWFDSQAKALMYYKDYTATATQATRIQQTAEAWLNNTIGSSTAFLLSSRSATGFVLYCSEIPVFMNGKRGIVPTQTVQLNTVTASPANKTFYFYVQWDGSAFILKPSLTTIPESMTSTYIGKVITGPSGVILSDLEKVTRIDTYRLGFTAPLNGSEIRAYENKPDIQGYVYDTTAEVNAFKSSHVPPSQSTVFNTWDRFNGPTAYFPGGAGATGDAAAWTFATNPDRIIQNNNTAALTGFISPDAYSDYDLEATFFSSNADDDGIGLSVAFARPGTTNIDLTVMRTCNGLNLPIIGTAARLYNFGFWLTGPTVATENRSVLVSKQVGNLRQNAVDTPNGWTSSYTKVKVVRRGNIITARCTDFSSTIEGVGEVLESSEISIDLSSIPELAPLTGSAKYGFTTISQAATSFYNVKFSGGLDVSRVVDLETNTVWKYDFASSSWVNSGILPKDELGYVRSVTNPDTGETYFVTQDTVIKQ